MVYIFELLKNSTLGVFTFGAYWTYLSMKQIEENNKKRRLELDLLKNSK